MRTLIWGLPACLVLGAVACDGADSGQAGPSSDEMTPAMTDLPDGGTTSVPTPERPPDSAPRPESPADAGAAADAAAADAAAASPLTSHWFCATAASLCSCVQADLGEQAQGCAESDCCFVDLDGTCTCRLSAASLSCDELKLTLSAATTELSAVDSCPP